MSPLEFSNHNSGNKSLYEAPNGSFWVAFLLPQQITPDSSLISFGETSKYAGYYLLAHDSPKSPDDFVNHAWSFFGSRESQNQFGGIAWLLAIDDALSDGNTSLIPLQKHGSGFSLFADYNFNFGNSFSTLTVSGIQVLISLDTQHNRFLFSSTNPFITFNSNHLDSSTIPNDELEIPLTGRAMAGMRFIAGFNYGLDFTAFDTSSKFFFPNEQTSDLKELSYPVFRSGSPNEFIQCQVSINPLDLLNLKQLNTYLAFLGTSINNISGQSQSTIIATYFQSDYGVPIQLAPAVDLSSSNGSKNIPSETSAKLVFSEKSVDGVGSWYTVPSGQFTLGIEATNKKYLDANNQLRIICGLAGTESVSVTVKTSEGTGDKIAFKPGQKAYVPQFPIKELSNKVGANTTQLPLEGSYLTAWVGLVKNSNSGAEVIYHSQPQGSALYTKNANCRFLDYFIANTSTLSDGNDIVFFPMVAYGNSISKPEKVDLQKFEFQILAQRRKTIIAASSAGQAQQRAKRMGSDENSATGNVISTSPQGFYIKVSQDLNSWINMKLASNAGHTLEFKNLSPKLQSAFQTNQLFLVVSSNVSGVMDRFESQMEVEGWPFDIKIPKLDSQKPNTGHYDNILIFKYCDQSLQDRVKNIQYWTDPENFNDTRSNGLPNISNWISDYLEKGIDKYTKQNDPDYYKFYKLATDPNWRGVLALKVDISSNTFPKELQGLLVGIELNRFNAHHFGIDLSVVEANGNTISMRPTSSLFGLIDYQDQVYERFDGNIETYQKEAPINGTVDYVYDVLLLKVLFSNSRITNFNSFLAFTINKLFDETVKPTTRENLLILKGTYENHNGVPSYVFNTTGDNLLPLESQVINAVEILKADFVTLVSQSADSHVESRFSFFGYLNFHKLKGFDLLSFGSEGKTPVKGQGISFSNLYVDLSFSLNKPTDQNFAFDIGGMAFDIGASYARQGSPYRHFPLQLAGIVKGDKDNLPASQGYLNVQLPSLEEKEAIQGNWYGLVFKLNMGTLGSLASSAGFNVTFMTPWNVGGKGAAAGLKLPGANPQAPALSLQGVIKMDFGTISLGFANDGRSYLMKINSISLKVLSLSFPPNAQMGFLLFGNPSTTAPPESLGWYAAYKSTRQ